MKKMIALTLFSCLLFIHLQAQTNWQWAKGSAGGILESGYTAVDKNGNVYSAGNSNTANVFFNNTEIIYPFTSSLSNAGLFQTVITKYNNSGSLQWAKGIMTGESLPVGIATDNDGNLILWGAFLSHITIDTFNLYPYPSATIQYFLAKINPEGNTVWVKSSGQASTTPINVLDTLYYIGAGSGQAYFMSLGGIVTDAGNNIYVTGSFNTATDTIGSYRFNNTDGGFTDDILVAKYDSTGNLIWANAIGGDKGDEVLGITLGATGNVYISGAFWSDTLWVGADTLTNLFINSPKSFIAAFSATGAPVWGIAGGSSGGSYCAGLASDNTGNIYVSGAFADSFISFGSSRLNSIYPSAIPFSETFIMKLSEESHNFVWQKATGSPSDNVLNYTIAYSSQDTTAWVGNCWVNSSLLVTSLADSVNINDSIKHTPDSSDFPLYLVGYDDAGNMKHFAALQDGSDDQFTITCDPQGNVFVTADYLVLSGVYDYFFAGPDTLYCDTCTISLERQYVAKYGVPWHTGIANVENEHGLMVYPNPATAMLMVTTDDMFYNNYTITDLLGTTLLHQVINATTTSININNLIPGMYYIVFKNESSYTVRKFVKE